MVYKSCKEADLKNRVAKALQDYPEGNIAAIMWRGYIACVFTGTVGLISYEDCDES